MNAEKLVMDWLNAAPELKDYPASFEVPAKSSSHEPYPVRHRGTHGRFGRPVRVETIDRCAGVGRFTLGGFGRGTASRAATVETHR